MNIQGTEITRDGKPYIIAEIGHNHQGSVEKAAQIMRAAADAGFDAAKFQKRDNKTLFTEAQYNAPYNSENAFGPTYGLHRDALELDGDAYVLLQDLGRKMGLSVFATAFDIESARFCRWRNFPAYKVASGDLTNIPLIKHLAEYKRPLIISTGGGTMDDVRRAYHAAVPICGPENLAILQCTAAYPAEPEHLHLRVIEAYLKEFPDVVIGFSDHQNGIAMAVAALALGARIFEKHVTVNRAWKGTDQAFSLEREGMRRYVRDIHRAYEALGSPTKRVLDIEEAPIRKMGKSIVAARDLKAGEAITPEDIAYKSPAGGMAPWKQEKVLGRSLTQDWSKDQPLSSGALS